MGASLELEDFIDFLKGFVFSMEYQFKFGF